MPGLGGFKCCIINNWTRFSFFKTFHFSSKRLSSSSRTEETSLMRVQLSMTEHVERQNKCNITGLFIELQPINSSYRQ